jgi:hypothetical protein
MTQKPLSETVSSISDQSWLTRVDRIVRRPRIIAVALAFSAANAAAAVSVLLWSPEEPRRSIAVPEVTLSHLAPAVRTDRVVVDNVVMRLPRAQTWHPPHMLPSQRAHSAGPDVPRQTPVLLMVPETDGAPVVDAAIPPLELASATPRDISPAPQPEVRLASLMPLSDSVTPSSLRPRARPDLPDLGPLATDTVGLTASLRPLARPVDLNVPVRLDPQQQVVDQPPATTTLAALPREVQRPVAKGSTCNQRLARSIPNRKGSAKGGSSVMAGLMRVSGTERDRIVAREIMAGNAPSFLQDLVPVEVTGRTKDGSNTRIVFCVMPDYLAVGSDRDFVRVPLGLPAATQIAARFDMMLPTRRMVDQIYRASDLRVSPQPMTPGPHMSSTDYLLRHNATVEGQVRGASARSGKLVSGHKKDLVMTNRLESNRGRVAIYGWHRSNGKAIQPLSTVHGKNYADYSHGIRLISQTAYLNGKAIRLADLFANPTYAGLISDEGPIRAAQLQLASAN